MACLIQAEVREHQRESAGSALRRDEALALRPVSTASRDIDCLTIGERPMPQLSQVREAPQLSALPVPRNPLKHPVETATFDCCGCCLAVSAEERRTIFPTLLRAEPPARGQPANQQPTSESGAIEAALPAWEALSVCCAEYSRIADRTRDLAISDGTGAASGVEILVENLLPMEPLASRGAQCPVVRIREGAASAECVRPGMRPVLQKRPHLLNELFRNTGSHHEFHLSSPFRPCAPWMGTLSFSAAMDALRVEGTLIWDGLRAALMLGRGR